ncbi:hypothetical protein Clacol_002884 [Clathrus columnatus]|uniref:Zinc finger PHD-type domain-containing protein n=1 Tax=Clathrus columnatus TaxID=1419009 RepID=A0AAV5A9S4_9AGAM|nr:hypothetical protein Clacol_002884 [Clathrus columnatus]
MRFGRKLSVPPPQPPAPSAEILALRSNWKWAYLSHFLFTFNPVLHLEEIQLSELEDDLAAGTYLVIPTIMQRLLMSLTPHDKRVILEDWQQQLRKQSMKRSPDDNLMGSDDDPVDFESLIMSDKLELFYRMCEWQFHNSNSLRIRMRDDDEYANWRIEPIAFDAKGNAYWLLGGNRLWMQYAPSRKTTVKTKKRKRITLNATAATPTTTNYKPSRRKQALNATSSTAQNTASAHSKTVSTFSPSFAPPPLSTRTRKPIRDTRSQAAGLPPTRPRVIGTRASSRLRGKEEEWQEIPEEWLKESQTQVSNGKKRENNKGKEEEFGPEEEGDQSNEKSALELIDDGSELTSLSDLSELSNEGMEEHNIDVGEDDDEYKEGVDAQEEEHSPSPVHDYSTPEKEVWKTVGISSVCVTLEDWEEFPKQFSNSTNKRERAFYKLLVNELVPAIIEVLKVKVKKQVVEDAIVHRKRSSRLAIKESLREAEKTKKAEAEKEMDRHRRWEARARKEVEERSKLENLRSVRLKEKAGIFTDRYVIIWFALFELWLNCKSNSARSTPETKPETLITNGATGIESHDITNAVGDQPIPMHVKRGSSSKSGTLTPKEDESWELDCEVCQKRGWNLDDGQELMCCEKCNRWQHIRCHDQADFIAGRPRRNWEAEEFVCNICTTGRLPITQQSQSKLLQPPLQFQSHPSLTNYSPLPKLQLHPSHQQQPSYPQQPHIPSQNWVMYNGATGTNIKNGKSIPANANTTKIPKGKNKAYERPVPMQTGREHAYGNGHSYPYPPMAVETRQSSVSESSYSKMSPLGDSLSVPSSRLLAPAPSNPPPISLPSSASTHSLPGHTYLATPNAYLPDYSGHYAVSVNSNLQYSITQRNPSTSSPRPPSNSSPYGAPTANVAAWIPQQPVQAWSNLHSTRKLDNGGAKSGPQSYTTAAMAAGSNYSNGDYISSLVPAPPSNFPGLQQGPPAGLSYSGVASSASDPATSMHPTPR